MHRAWVIATRLAVLAALAGCAHGSVRQATAGPPPGRGACFRPQDVSAWSAAHGGALTLRVNVHDYFRMTLASDCGALDLGRKVGLQARAGDWICEDEAATLVSITPAGLQQRCSIAAVQLLTPQEVAALPRGERP